MTSVWIFYQLNSIIKYRELSEQWVIKLKISSKIAQKESIPLWTNVTHGFSKLIANIASALGFLG